MCKEIDTNIQELIDKLMENLTDWVELMRDQSDEGDIDGVKKTMNSMIGSMKEVNRAMCAYDGANNLRERALQILGK